MSGKRRSGPRYILTAMFPAEAIDKSSNRRPATCQTPEPAITRLRGAGGATHLLPRLVTVDQAR